MAKKKSEFLKNLYKSYANEAATYSCEMEYYIDCGNYNMAEFYNWWIEESLKYARHFKEQYLKWKKIEEGA